MAKVGDKIRITCCTDPFSGVWYTGREGVITSISKDPWGDTAYYGTWGGLSLYPSAGDKFVVIEEGK